MRGVLTTYKLIHSSPYPCGACGKHITDLKEGIHATYRLKGHNRMPLYKIFCSKRCLSIFERTTNVALLTKLLTTVEGLIYHPSIDMNEDIPGESA